MTNFQNTTTREKQDNGEEELSHGTSTLRRSDETQYNL